MAAMTIHGLMKQFGTQIVLRDVSLTFGDRETVGLVGPNGAGKTTLFRLMAGELEPDLGTITGSRGLDIGYLEQEPQLDLTRTLHDEVGSVFEELLALEARLQTVADEIATHADDPMLPEIMEKHTRLTAQFEAAGGHRFETALNEILGGLGFSQDDYTKSMAVMSGGQKCRAALAKLLLEERHLLLLDEPTNHLDIDAVRWLEKFLAGHQGTSIVISHDRYLLDRVCTRIVEVDRCSASSYPGNYTNYANTREMRLLTEQRRFEKDSAFVEKERAFISKHIAGQRTREAKGRRTRLERRLQSGEFVTETTRPRRKTAIGFSQTSRATGTILRCDDLGMSFDSLSLFADLTLQVPAGQRLGVTGPNGTGKSTLLKIILGKIAPTGGSVTLDPKLSVGYYSQEPTHLDPSRTLVEEIRDGHSELSEQEARSYLARFLFTGNDVFKTLGVLSGGEQSRVRIARLILSQPQLLILDEPTNHLDISSREAVEEALCAFDGTLIVVSHDRYFLDRVVERLLVIRPTGHALYEGNYSFYAEQLDQSRSGGKKRTGARKAKANKGAGGVRSATSGPSLYDRLTVDEIEAMVIDRETELGALSERFGDPAVCRDPDALAELKAQVASLEADLAVLDSVWHERVDQQ